MLRGVLFFLAIEVKRSPWKKPADDHERKQLEFLCRVSSFEGVGFFATSIDEAKAGIERRLSGIYGWHPLSEVNPVYLQVS